MHSVGLTIGCASGTGQTLNLFVGVYVHAQHDGVGDLLGSSPRVCLHLLSHEEGSGGLAGNKPPYLCCSTCT